MAAASALPAASITSPAAGATIKGSRIVTATASADTGRQITLVEFYFDDLRFADDTTAPYTATWNTLSSTLPPFDGAHSLTVRAYDDLGQVSTSAPVNISVANTTGTRFKARITPRSYVSPVMSYDPTADAQKTQQVAFVITNTSGVSWPANTVSLRYRWYSTDTTWVSSDAPAEDPGGITIGQTTAEDGTIVDSTTSNDCACASALADPASGSTDPGLSPVVAEGANELTLASNVAAGAATAPITLTIHPPTLPVGVDRARYRLQVDLYDSASGGGWFAAKGNKPVDHPIQVNKELMAEALGLEQYYHCLMCNT